MHTRSVIAGAGGTVAVAAGIFFAVAASNAQPVEPPEPAPVVIQAVPEPVEKVAPPEPVEPEATVEPTPEPVEEPVTEPAPQPEPAAPAPAPAPAPEPAPEPAPTGDAYNPPRDLDLGPPPEAPPAEDIPGGPDEVTNG